MTEILPAVALEQHVGIVGKTGSGKTSTAKLIIEQVVAEGSRVCVLDPIKSDWWGMISSSDGKHAGLPFNVLGGPHGHVPLHSGAGAAIADLVARRDLPLSILDMAQFEPGGQLRFFVDFAPRLLQRMTGVLYLVLEEAHLFAPKERSGMGHEQMSIHWAKMLATAGRSKGVRVIVATQRTQSLHNAMLGSCETMIVHRLTAPADQKPVIDWLKANVQDMATRAEIVDTMSSLRTGSGWVCSGEAKLFKRVNFGRISTFDNSATPTEDARDVTVKGADVDMGALRALIGEAVTEAEANDPAKLKARIAELEAGLDARPRQMTKDDVHQARLYADRVAELEKVCKDAAKECGVLKTENERQAKQLHKIGLIALELTDVLGKHEPMPPDNQWTEEEIAEIRARGPGPVVPINTIRTAPKLNGHAKADLGAGARRCLTVLVQHNQRGGVTRSQLMALTGYADRSISNYLSELRGADFLREGVPLLPTHRGVIEIGNDYEPLPTGDALRAYWLDRLDAGPRKVLNLICSRRTSGITKAELCEQSSYADRSVSNYLSELRTRRLIHGVGRKLHAASELFG